MFFIFKNIMPERISLNSEENQLAKIIDNKAEEKTSESLEVAEKQEEKEIVLTEQEKNTFIKAREFVKNGDMSFLYNKGMMKSCSKEDWIKIGAKLLDFILNEEDLTTNVYPGRFWLFEIIKNEFSVPEEMISQNDVSKNLIFYLKKDDTERAIAVLNCFSEPFRYSLVQTQEFYKAVKDLLVEKIKWSDSSSIVKIKQYFPVSEQILQSLDLKNAAKFGLETSLGNNINKAVEIKKIIPVEEDFFQTIENQQRMKWGIAYLFEEGLEEGNIFDLDTLSKELFITKKTQQEGLKEGMIKVLSNPHPNLEYIDKNLDKYNIENKKLFIEDVVSEVIANRITEVSAGYRDRMSEVDNIIKHFAMSPDIIQQSAKKSFLKVFETETPSLTMLMDIKEKFSLSEEFIQTPEVHQAAKEGFINCLKNGIEVQRFEGSWMDDAMEIKEKFSIPEDFFQFPEVHKVLKEIFIKRLENGRIDRAMEIKESFSLILFPQELIIKDSELETLLFQLKEISPEFYDQALKSVDIIIALFPVAQNPERINETIKSNPFLIEAVSKNPRFGSKLLVKYPELDETSQENINFQFKAKKEILEENPDIDPESNEFRIAMQEKLKTYKNNEEILLQIECLGIRNELIKELAEKAEKEILEENLGIDIQSNDYRVALRGKIKEYKKDEDILKDMEFSGIDTDQWLNYSETEYFSLDSGESKLAFSETVATLINRIKETIASYSYRVKEVIKEYQKELKEFKIQAGNVDETSELIKKMESELAKAKEENNEAKVKGIEKGIASFQEKMKKGKKIPLWDKVIGDINAFDRLKNDVFLSHENVIRAEEKFKEYTQDKSHAAMDIMEAKRVLAKAKGDLKEKFGLLEKRIEDFRNNFVSVLEPALGKDRSESLLQEIQQGLGEQFDHYDSDRSTLANLFSERSDKEKEKLDSRPMSIFVWARNPDIDLYQGNYNDCCIKINSDHMGAESTIADYNTDLGIQIVNIWDETKNEPITCAWCWIGKDSDGNAALVVDNIESNTLYSSNYSEQLTDKLFDYLKNYAKNIGIKKVVMGKTNNDLPTASELAKLNSSEKEYQKVGGYNRYNGEDEEGGYYLEAEGTSVKTIWEEKAKKREKKERKIKVEYKNREFKSLVKNDLSDILKLEEKVYEEDDLSQGEDLREDIESGKGFDYSVVLTGEKEAGKKEIIGYAIGVEDETDENKPCVYLEDIVVAPEAQGQGFGWEIMRKMIEKIKEKAAKENKPVLFDMHLRDSSRQLMEKHKEDLERLGLALVDEALIPDYYSDGDDSLYQVYEVKG